jgi:cobalt-zinc-cadmium efflux system membrane fusion protein
MANNNRTLLIFVSLILSIGCSQRGKEITYNPFTNSYSICLDDKHKILSEITTTNLTKQFYPEYIECNGITKPSFQNQAFVSAPIQGFVKGLFIRNGEYVEKGKTLAILENTDYIEIQENYLIAKSQYDYFKEDFKRQGELSLESATSLKVMQQAQNEFRKTEVKLFSLKKILEIIGINSDSIRVDYIQSTIELKATISGRVNLLNTKLGAICSGDNPLCEITGIHGQIIYFKLDENQADKIEVNQPVEFSISKDPSKLYKSKVFSILPVSDDPKKIEVYADIIDDIEGFDSGLSVNAKIFTGNDSVDVLPDEAIIRSENKTFIIIKTENNCFKPIEIISGKSIEKMSRILIIPDELRKAEFVVKGSNILYQEIKKLKKKSCEFINNIRMFRVCLKKVFTIK